MVNMKCRLCNQDKKLIKAHIYPAFFYKNLGLYSPDLKGQGRVHKAIISDNNIYYSKKGLPEGLYDPFILCQACDNYFNEEFENYANNVLFDNTNSNKVKLIADGIELATFTGIDYTKFKLFMLSVFWRASISNKFPEIKLCSNDEEVLRSMFITKDAKEEDEYGVLLLYLNDPEITAKLLTDIKTLKTDNKTCHSFIAGGFLFYLYHDKFHIPSCHKDFLLTKNGILKIPKFPKGKSKQILNEFYGGKIFN